MRNPSCIFGVYVFPYISIVSNLLGLHVHSSDTVDALMRLSVPPTEERRAPY